ncbi:hypothetical protein GCM10025862_37480 [Arsenicicoccus piscis]|uniref:Diguanylate cyclase n=2 Tax=Arsenicicoccus piscis TaxID=673954 RepID=A0ABQ6HJX9_9MICO|nr:hypothetical protein GCM10025862_00350 [Arsenicicoccus piscis]GMA21727.1 hypothetical protein GCM10025862_37480 [Arsenicicoccus piscis]
MIEQVSESECRTVTLPQTDRWRILLGVMEQVAGTPDHGATQKATPVYDAATYRLLLDTLPLGIVVHGADGYVVEANQQFADMLGYDLAETRGLSSTDVIHPADQAERDRDAARLVSGQTSALSVERRLVHRDGSLIHARVRKAAVDLDGDRLVMVVIEDWTHEHEAIQALSASARQDSLTGLMNRRGLFEVADRVATGARADEDWLVTVLDVDGLKGVNDSFGHPAGDALLDAVARGLQALAATDWSLGRVSGDEFVVIAPADGTTAMDRTITIGESLDQALAGCSDTRIAHAGASVGTAHWRPVDEELVAAISTADQRMYRRKRHRHAMGTGTVPLPEAGGEPGGEAGGLVHPTGSA